MADKINYRGRVDALLSGSSALPSGATTANVTLDLENTESYPISEEFQVCIATTAATGANNKNINTRLMHSDEENANFTNISGLPNPLLTVTDNNGGGYSAGEVVFNLPPATKRYIRSVSLGEANGGNAANGTVTMQLLF